MDNRNNNNAHYDPNNGQQNNLYYNGVPINNGQPPQYQNYPSQNAGYQNYPPQNAGYENYPPQNTGYQNYPQQNAWYPNYSQQPQVYNYQQQPTAPPPSYYQQPQQSSVPPATKERNGGAKGKDEFYDSLVKKRTVNFNDLSPKLADEPEKDIEGAVKKASRLSAISKIFSIPGLIISLYCFSGISEVLILRFGVLFNFIDIVFWSGWLGVALSLTGMILAKCSKNTVGFTDIDATSALRMSKVSLVFGALIVFGYLLMLIKMIPFSEDYTVLMSNIYSCYMFTLKCVGYILATFLGLPDPIEAVWSF